MSKNNLLRLNAAPRLITEMPTCSACCVKTEWEEGFICPACGTYWPDCAGYAITTTKTRMR